VSSRSDDGDGGDDPVLQQHICQLGILPVFDVVVGGGDDINDSDDDDDGDTPVEVLPPGEATTTTTISTTTISSTQHHHHNHNNNTTTTPQQQQSTTTPITATAEINIPPDKQGVATTEAPNYHTMTDITYLIRTVLLYVQ